MNGVGMKGHTNGMGIFLEGSHERYGTQGHANGKKEPVRPEEGAKHLSRRGIRMVLVFFCEVNQNGGERGIRTLGTLVTHTHFPGEPLQPLGHLSANIGRIVVELKKLT